MNHFSYFQVILLITLYLSSSIHSLKYNDYFIQRYGNSKEQSERYQRYKYPTDCCQLEWKQIKQNERLPTDYVHGGSFMNRDYGYIIQANDVKVRGIYSDQSREKPINLFNSDQLNEPFYVLINPYNCSLDWYKTRFFNEEIPLKYEDKYHFPRMELNLDGDYVRVKDEVTNETIPGYFDTRNNGIMIPNTLSSSKVVQPENYEFLFVNCEESLLRMSNAILYNITYDEQDISNLKSNVKHVEYARKFIVNNSPEVTYSNVDFSIESSDKLTMKTKESHFKFFTETSETYHKWNVKLNYTTEWTVRLALFVQYDGSLEVVGGYGGKYKKKTKNGTIDEETTKIMEQNVKRKTFEFSQQVKVPPFSKTVITAFAKPIQGSVPFTAIYELFPVAGADVDSLESMLVKYGMKQKMERTNQGSLLVYYDGFMDVDAGNEIDVTIKTVKME